MKQTTIMFMTAEVLGKFFLLQKDTRCGFPMATAATTNSLLFVRPRPMFGNNIKRSQMMMACCCSVGEQVFSVTPSNNYEVDYLGQSTKGDLNLNLDHLDAELMVQQLFKVQLRRLLEKMLKKLRICLMTWAFRVPLQQRIHPEAYFAVVL